MRTDRMVAVLCSVLMLSAGCGTSRPTDEAIVTGIQAKMFSDAGLKTAPITVTVRDGIVTLSGQVPDEKARETAQAIAANARGVSKVIDRTTIASEQVASAVTAQKNPMVAPAPTARPEVKKTTRATGEVTATPGSGQPPADAPQPPLTSKDVIPRVAPAPEAEPGPVEKEAAKPSPPVPATPPAPTKPEPITVTIPEGTVISVRTVDTIDSSVNTTGQSFRSSLDAPILVQDKVVVPKDLNVTLKLVNASSAGRISGKSELTVSLDNFIYQGKRYVVASSDVQQQGASRGKKSAAVIGGGAVLGAIIGGIAGGGRAAAIGAAAGGGGGTAVQALTKGEQVRIPAETKLDFTLHAPIDVSYVPSQKVAAGTGPTTTQTNSERSGNTLSAGEPGTQSAPATGGTDQTVPTAAKPPEK